MGTTMGTFRRYSEILGLVDPIDTMMKLKRRRVSFKIVRLSLRKRRKRERQRGALGKRESIEGLDEGEKS